MRVLSYQLHSYMIVYLAFFFLSSHRLCGRDSAGDHFDQDSLGLAVWQTLKKNSKDRVFLRLTFNGFIHFSKCYARHVKTSVRHLSNGPFP